MQCFSHRGTDAVGVCHVCGRGVCDACARVSPLHLTCSEACEERQKLTTAIVDFSGRSVDAQTRMRFPIGAVLFFLIGTGMLVVGLLPKVTGTGPVEWYSCFMGFVFTCCAIAFYRVSKRITGKKP